MSTDGGSNLTRSERIKLVLRSFAVQGTFNYRTLIGPGFAFSLLPVLRRIHGSDSAGLRDAMSRHSGIFNSHPYLVTVALGAVARMEAEGEPPEMVERFKSALRGSLGTLGDRLFWAGWRPVCLLGALLILAAGAPWWLPVLGFLAVYNAGHLVVRFRGLSAGAADGRHVARRLRDPRIERIQRLLYRTGPFLAGLLIPLVAAGALGGGGMEPVWVIAALLAGLLAAVRGEKIRAPMAAALGGVAVLGWIIGVAA